MRTIKILPLILCLVNAKNHLYTTCTNLVVLVPEAVAGRTVLEAALLGGAVTGVEDITVVTVEVLCPTGGDMLETE